MAKGDNIVTSGLQGTINTLTFVNSKSYGDHVRSPRGTFKPAVLNETMQQSSSNLLLVNNTARLFFNCIRNECKDGTLWSRMLSILRAQLKAYNLLDVTALLHLECSKKTPLSKLLPQNYALEASLVSKNALNISLQIGAKPTMRKRELRYTQVSVHVIFYEQARNKVYSEVVRSKLLLEVDYPLALSVAIPVPLKATSYAVFLKVTECKDGEAMNWPQSTGMCCVAVDTIERKKRQPAAKKKVKAAK